MSEIKNDVEELLQEIGHTIQLGRTAIAAMSDNDSQPQQSDPNDRFGLTAYKIARFSSNLFPHLPVAS